MVQRHEERWRICEVYGEKFAVFRLPSKSAELDQLADQEASETRSQSSSTAADSSSFQMAAPGPEVDDQPQMALVQGSNLNGLLNNCCISSCCNPLR
ncbi:hypothetical protein TorRG33x02_175230 [Trema orientale]|uniref:Uncharacterized protein n=1 Tax=Trema orientale TaxID=63057 RepID=A0A2P5EMA2_TREOI|nr:hypothetical protein TorRG33x02_175230 [Trema orientale]